MVIPGQLRRLWRAMRRWGKPIDRRRHWEATHLEHPPGAMGWFQAVPRVSLELMDLARMGPDSRIIDVGGGISRLTDHLLERGHLSVTVLDLSAAALQVTKRRVGEGAQVRWIVGDVLEADLGGPFDIWHDRAVFHFFTDPDAQRRYAERLYHALAPGGHAVIATFAEDGPTQCNGLPVTRYAPDALHARIGTDRFRLVTSRRETHVTPGGRKQRFQYCLLERR